MDNQLLEKLVIKAPMLELRLPDEKEIVELARIAANGIQNKGEEYYQADWLNKPYPENKHSFSQWILNDRNKWKMENWSLGLAGFYEGKPIGMQHIFSRNFNITKGFGTGVWLGLPHQGKGFGTEMGKAILYFGFQALGGQEAYAGAWGKNEASIHVLEKLGYIPNGQYIETLNGKAEVNRRMRLPKNIWDNSVHQDIVIEGFNDCKQLFGLA